LRLARVVGMTHPGADDLPVVVVPVIGGHPFAVPDLAPVARAIIDIPEVPVAAQRAVGVALVEQVVLAFVVARRVGIFLSRSPGLQKARLFKERIVRWSRSMPVSAVRSTPWQSDSAGWGRHRRAMAAAEPGPSGMRCAERTRYS